MKLLFMGGVSFAAFVLSGTCLMPILCSSLEISDSHKPGRVLLEDLIAPSALDPRLASSIRELQAYALLGCIAAQPSESGPNKQDALLARRNAARYEAIYSQLNANPSMQQALARMQAAQIRCGSSVARSLENFQRAAYALDHELDSVTPGSLVLTGASRLQIGD